MKRFRRIKAIGSGSYGSVYLAYDTKRKQHVAAKRFNAVSEPSVWRSALREASMMRELGEHPNIVGFRHLFVSKSQNRLTLITDYLSGGELRTGVSRHPELCNPINHRKIMVDICRGMAFMHSKGVMHRDIKPGNLLLDDTGRVFIADFGISTALAAFPGYTTRAMTRAYRAPELFLGDRNYGPAVDMWSVGCIMVEIWTNRGLFHATKEHDTFEFFCHFLGTPSESTWPGVVRMPLQRLVPVSVGVVVVNE